VRWLVSLGYSELNLEGVGMIMADATLQFKSEIFYGDELEISLQPVEFSRVGFDLVYKIEKKSSGDSEIAAVVRTSMICYDYSLKKVTGLPETAKNKMISGS
jgi:acyl-CoA thioesterase FadM